MLATIDNIPWSSLKHAYGFADDVPQQIKDLGSQDDQIRESALYELYGNVYHQGTRYEASPYVVPFIYELLQSEKVAKKEELIYFLVSIALGSASELLPSGINSEEFRIGLKNEYNDLTTKELDKWKVYGLSPLYILDCYEAVNKNVPILQELVKEKNVLIQDTAIYSLGWFPDYAKTSIPIIRDFLPQLEDENRLANALLALGLLYRNSSLVIDTALFEPYLQSKSLLVKSITAISLACNPLKTEILALLIEGLNGFEHIESDQYIFQEHLLFNYISQTLLTLGNNHKITIISALCGRLKTINQYYCTEIVEVLSIIINRNKSLPVKNIAVDDLENIEILALKTIAAHECNGVIPDCFTILGNEGFPDSREALLEYLDQS